jgi:hypothetical protein
LEKEISFRVLAWFGSQHGRLARIGKYPANGGRTAEHGIFSRAYAMTIRCNQKNDAISKRLVDPRLARRVERT